MSGHYRCRGACRRRGAVIVEFAAIVPVILLIVFATIDLCSLYYLRQSAKLAAYEACRIGVSIAGEAKLVENQATRVLNSRRIQGFDIDTIPNINAVKPGELLTVRVTFPSSTNLPLRGWLTGSADVVAEVSMASEK